jgi:dCTP deaminase
MLKNDKWIIKQAKTNGMIHPFVESLISVDPEFPGIFGNVLSYGVSSFGYDLRLSAKSFRIFQHVPGTVMNPKAFNEENLRDVVLREDEYGEYFILPAHSYGLGVAVERLTIPRSITVVCIGKSTYARMGIILNVTPAESEWSGHLTLEFSNSSGADCRLYANEGVCQALFFEGEDCLTSYGDRSGKYQGQEESVVTARV